MKKIEINFTLNGTPVTVKTDPNKRLLDMLREDCEMLSVKEGCGEGECGACTVVLNGNAVTSCLVMAGQVEGANVVTLEHLAVDGDPGDIQRAFIDAGAVQCGFCTPGMIMTAAALLEKNPNPTEEEIKIGMSGNLCRCTGYAKIIKAVEMVRDERLAASVRGGKTAKSRKIVKPLKAKSAPAKKKSVSKAALKQTTKKTVRQAASGKGGKK
ncbi:MAG: (2Fe-2S)-binding protein [Lachnospiraceae bacterium]|nr:(2Fe-2S)-binding protein [Lachnospiraceae bacterium]